VLWRGKLVSSEVTFAGYMYRRAYNVQGVQKSNPLEICDISIVVNFFIKFTVFT